MCAAPGTVIIMELRCMSMGALNGYKVLDFSTLLPGPYATMTLADMGAEVLKVSARDKYDLVAYASPIDEDELNGTPALPAIGLITGLGEDEFLEKALEIFKAAGK